MSAIHNQAAFYDARYEHGYYYASSSDEWGWAGRFAKARANLLLQMLRNAGFDSALRVLEIGAGARPFSPFLPDAERRKVVLTDVSANALRHAQPKRGNETSIVCDAARPPFKGPFDLVIAVELIEHLVDPDAAMAAWASVLRPGGMLAITTPNGRFTKPTEEHISLLEIDDLLALYEKHGFEQVALKGVDLALVPAWPEHEAARLLSFFPAASSIVLGAWMRAPRNHPHIAQGLVALAKKKADAK